MKSFCYRSFMVTRPQSAYCQPTLFGLHLSQPKITTTRFDLEKRLTTLRELKLELEEKDNRKKKVIKKLCRRINKLRHVIRNKHLFGKQLDESLHINEMMKNRMRELGERIKEKQNDCHRLQKIIDKFKTEKRCQICKEVKRVELFPKDPDRMFGRDDRCNMCQREKAVRYRAQKRITSLNENHD